MLEKEETTRPQNNRDKMATWKTNKLLIYKTIFKPIWTYGIVLWGCASKSNIAIKQRYQSKILRTITNAPRYVTNQTLHTICKSRSSTPSSKNAFINTVLTGISPQPPCGTNATPRAQYAIKPKIDLRHEQLRRREWPIT
jgi:hypothetical protein